jgi:hypothetical protein
MGRLNYSIADELHAIAHIDAELQKRIERMLEACPVEIKDQITATSLGMESGYAKDAAFLAELLDEKADAS